MKNSWCLAVVGLCLASGTPALAQREREPAGDFLKSNPKVLAAFRDAVAAASQATVRVRCDDKDAALGTVVGSDGWVLTKHSELKGDIVCKLKDGREQPAKIVGVQEKYDLALLKIDAKGLKVVAWAESKTAPVGHWLASPGTSDGPIAVGVVSVAARSLPAGAGPPVPNSGYLGVALDNNDTTAAKVTDVLKGTGAEKAGLKVNDVILSVAGQAIEDLDAFMATIGKLKAGEVITLKIKREDKELELKATLGKRPAGRGDFQNNLGSELSGRRNGFPTILQHDTVLKPTDCGGPLCDLDGKVIGVNIARAGRTESYAVPAEDVQKLLPDLQSGKLAPKEPTGAKKVTAAKKKLELTEKALREAEQLVQEAKKALEQAEKEARDEK